MIGGQIDGVCDAATSVSQPIEEKLVKGLVIGSSGRLENLPDLPTAAEAGIPEFDAQGWNGLFAPKGTPPAVLAKLNAAVAKQWPATPYASGSRICPQSCPTKVNRRRTFCSSW